MATSHLHWRPIAVLLLVALVWGANMAMVKLGAREIPPLLMAGVRSAVAGFCLFVWIKVRGGAVFPSRVVSIHGAVVGLIFGSEFALVFVGLKFTLASRAYVLLYIAPFFAAMGAHFFLQGDRITPWKAGGLMLAFSGIVLLFVKDLGTFSFAALPGDLMILGAGALWGSTTVYIKKYLARAATPFQTLFYQLFFSAPLLLLLSVFLEEITFSGISWIGGFSLFYQCIIVAFLSYLVWFEMVARYPVSLLHAFSFFTPLFGVFLSGVLILGENIGANLIGALWLVSLGMVLVNHRGPSATAMPDKRFP